MTTVNARLTSGTVFDIIEGDMDFNPTTLRQHLQDKDNILLILQHPVNHKYVFLSRSIFRSQMNMNDSSNGIVLICKEAPLQAMMITPDLLRDLTPYFNLRKIALYGYVLASQIQAIIKGTHQIYILSEIDTALSVVSWGFYNSMTGASSASHCQPGSGGIIYNLEMVNPEWDSKTGGKLNPFRSRLTGKRTRRKRKRTRKSIVKRS